MIGITLGNRYQICAEIGEGGMASVYRAVDSKLGRDIAIKILHPHLAKDKDLATRFHNEASIAAKLDHPNILRIFDYGMHLDGRSYMVSELVRGQDMHLLQIERLKKTGLPFEDFVVLMICEEVLKGLTAAHGIGVVHRDIKPDNVMISDDGQVKLMDFGIAKSNMTNLTVTGHFLGSPSYSSPEQVQGLEIDGRSDLYSLGIILYESLTGRLPFTGMSASDVMLKIIGGKCTHPSEIKRNISRPLGDFVMKAMSPKKEDRFADASEMLIAVKKLLKPFGIENARAGLEEFFQEPSAFALKAVSSASIGNSIPLKNEVVSLQKIPEIVVEQQPKIQENKKKQQSFARTLKKSLPFSKPSTVGHKSTSNFSMYLLTASALFVFAIVIFVTRGTKEAAFKPTKKQIDVSETIEKNDSIETPSTATRATPPPFVRPTPKPTQPTVLPKITPKPTEFPKAVDNTKVVDNTKSVEVSKAQKTPVVSKAIQKSNQQEAQAPKVMLPKIQLQTLPSGIPIFIGRQLLGITNKLGAASVFSARPGPAELNIPSVTVDGVKYESSSRKIFLEPGKTVNLGVVTLTPMRKLSISILGPNVVVRVNGDPYALSGKPLVLNLPEGQVEIEAKASNGKTLRKVVLLKGENFNFNTSLN